MDTNISFQYPPEKVEEASLTPSQKLNILSEKEGFLITYFDKTTNIFYPKSGNGLGGCWDFNKNPNKTNLEFFVRGKGCIKIKIKNLVQKYVPILTSLEPQIVKEYTNKYGIFCASHFLNQWMAGYCVERYLYSCLSCNIPAPFFEEFKEKFKIGLFEFRDRMLGIFGRFYFDLPTFDQWLHVNCGYSEKKHGSLRDFLTHKFGSGFSGRFYDYVIRT